MQCIAGIFCNALCSA